jgi:Flp pilus assembly protein TadD
MDPAGAQFRETLKLDPKHTLAHRSLGLVLREMEDPSSAANELRLAVVELPNDPEGHQLLGTVLLKMNDQPGAIDSFQTAIHLNPGLADAHATLAQALQRTGRKEDAKEELAEIQNMNAANADNGRAMILVETAQAHIKKGNVTTAIKELQEAGSLSPDFAEAHYQLGLALSKSPGGSSQAETAFQRVLQLNPRDPAAYLQLALLLEARGDKTQASSLFAKAAQLAPGPYGDPPRTRSDGQTIAGLAGRGARVRSRGGMELGRCRCALRFG